ncbi:hypothetical protein [Raoultibacter phocaeensis]|uniref:hypothetical protein n=1 Tax=Raoultibacter phocaeensis TaxID=2479841 RepID=UPI0011193841|nr:hypothetical protein [Raoultibacter phocaeensis]
MSFALVFIVACGVVIALAGFIKRLPLLFYAFAVLAVVLLFAGTEGYIDGGWWKPLILLVKRCMLALSLFTIVMFTGALSRESWLGIRLRSIRSELSIVACILCAGHVCQYLVAYVSRAVAGSLDLETGASIFIALVLFVLLIVLGVTSGNAMKKRMRGVSWKRIQWFAYPFFLLTYVHLMLMIAPAAFLGSEQAMVNALVYSVVFAAYVIMRLYRYAKDKGAKASVEACKDTGGLGEG